MQEKRVIYTSEAKVHEFETRKLEEQSELESLRYARC